MSPYLLLDCVSESVMGIGTGTRMTPNKKGIAQITSEGMMWTSASRLSHLNGSKWTANGEVNTVKETVEVRVTLYRSQVYKNNLIVAYSISK